VLGQRLLVRQRVPVDGRGVPDRRRGPASRVRLDGRAHGQADAASDCRADDQAHGRADAAPDAQAYSSADVAAIAQAYPVSDAEAVS